MDAYSISCTSPSWRNTSRIYQDLRTSRLHSLIGVDAERLLKSWTVMGDAGEARLRGTSQKPHIGVIGAGLAGLRCADILLQYGFQVTIVEGRNRVGGRTVQETLVNGQVVDMGPNWIHGTDGNPIMDLAKQTDTAIGSWDTGSCMFDEDGKLFSVKDGEEYSALMWEIIQDAFVHSNKNSAEIDPQESLYDFFKKKVVEIIPETVENAEKKRGIILQMAELWGAYVGSPAHQQSLKFFWLEECIDGENLFCSGTYQKILEAIAKPALEGTTIKYETTVSKFHGRKAAGEKTRITTTSGEVLEFDELVVTTPLGWLKKNLASFDPPLPPRITKAIQSIGYGCLEKVYISFPEAFWAAPHVDGRKVKGFCQWLSPKFAADTNPHRWTHDVVELSSLGHPTLLFYTSGDESQYITKMISALPAGEKRDAFLRDFFRPYYSRLPHYDPELAACRPTCFLATTWVCDDLAGNGSYCNFQVGVEEGDADVRAMREGDPDRGVWLAGEHTSPFVALGTATGAYWSGESVGRRIAEAYGQGK